MNRSDLDNFEKLVGQIQSIYEELSLLSKKSPSDAVNKFKLKFVNTLLAASNSLLGGEYKPFEEFTEFDLDDVPQNSDVVFILSQYLQCFEKFRADNVIRKKGSWVWVVDAEGDAEADKSGQIYVSTVKPKRLRE